MVGHSQQALDKYRQIPSDLATNGLHLVCELAGFEVAESKQQRALKGTVAVQCDDGWLRLRWSWGRKRYTMAIGLPDSKINRIVAERRAKLIEQDIVTDQFDPTLSKYRRIEQREDSIEVVELFDRFSQFKAKSLDAHSIQKYAGLMGHLRQFFRKSQASDVTEDRAIVFRDHLAKQIAPITVRERIGLLRSCWKWGIKRGLIKENPWLEVRTKVPPKQKPRPFNKEEVEKILEGFSSDPHYSHYSDFVEFLLSAGCRIGEAAALRWSHVTDDCSSIWIGESFVRGSSKSTKTNKERMFDLTPHLQAMLLKRKATRLRADDLVFPSPKGHPIDDHNFRNRAWKTVLEKINIPYRYPRSSRSTFVSHAIAKGLNPSEISGITGHTEETLLRHYLGSVKGRSQLPSLWD